VKEEDYVATKNRIARRMIDKFEKTLGVEITPYIEEIEVATPWTMCRFVNTPQGSAYGYELDDWDSMMARMRMMGTENQVKGLKFVGAASIRGDGYNSAIFSGSTMAKLTLADMKKEEEG
jgi:prolycopene isomerase